MVKTDFQVLVLILALTWSGCSAPEPTVVRSDVQAFVQVTVIPMESERVLEDQTVLVEDGKIVEVGQSSRIELPSGARVIEGDGYYLIPALADMHVHLEGTAWNVMFPPEAQFSTEALDFEDLLFPYLANGVTTVQVMSALPEHVKVRDQIEAGEILGPRLLLSRMIDGPERAWPPPISTWVGSPEEARQAVLDARQTGYDSMKVYSFLDEDSYRSIVTAARELDMGVVGHIPMAMSPEAVLMAGQDLIAHAEEVLKHAGGDFSQENIHRLAGLIAGSDTWITPTLTQTRHLLSVFEDFDEELSRPEVQVLHPMALGVWSYIESNLYRGIPNEHRGVIRQGFEAFQRPLTLALHQAGAKMMTGTDALIPSAIPGYSLHDELEELVALGISPFDALRMSTIAPMEFLGRTGDAGTVEPGKRADLVLLEANPLEDISNTRKIAGVMVAGRWFEEAEIQSRLEALATRNQALSQVGN